VPPDLEQRIASLTLPDVVDLALRNNPATRLSWARAREAAALYGATRGTWFPTLDLNGTFTRLKTVASQGRSAVMQSTYGAALNLSWLVLDVGGRAGQIEASKQALIAANWQHNTAIQDVVLQVASAYFSFVAERSLLQAQQVSLAEAETNLAAAEERRKVGVATITDVLQARTARAQARLAMEQTQGARQIARGLLAQSLGYPPTLSYDVDSTAARVTVAALVESVDSLIAQAAVERPELAAARAELRAARADVSTARADRLPSLNLSAAGGRTYTTTLPQGGNNYSVSLGLAVPLFSGFSLEYRQEAAEERVQQARAQLDQLQQQVAFQVYQSYYALQTATLGVRISEELVTSASLSADAARDQYKAGVGNVLDLLTAQAALANARAEEVRARLAWSTAVVQLSHDTGRMDARGQSSLRLDPDSVNVEFPR
jgi:TolC family type I secretion outer membrane protein